MLNNSWVNWYSKFFMLDMKYRLTCGELKHWENGEITVFFAVKLFQNVAKFQNKIIS